MENWVGEIFEGLEEVPKLSGTAGDIVVYGEHAQPIIANHKGQVLAAVAEYGQGRVAVFAHTAYVKKQYLTKANKDEKLARFYLNLKKWLTRGTLSETPVIEDFMTIYQYEGVDILLGTGSATPNDDHLKMLQDYLHNGGSMIIGETPWGFLQIKRKYTLKTMPMNKFMSLFGMTYTANHYKYPASLSVADNTANRSHLLHALKCVDDPELFKNHSKVIHQSLWHLPDDVFYSIKDDLLDAIQMHMGNIHMAPTRKKPTGKPEEKALVMLMVRAFKEFGSVHDLVKIPSCDVFPGDFEDAPVLECTAIKLEAPDFDRKCFHPTGFYVPAGQEITVKVLSEEPEEGEEPWVIAIGSHTDELFNTEAAWRRWPTVHVKRKVLPQENPLDVKLGDIEQCTEEEVSNETDCEVTEGLEGQCIAQQSDELISNSFTLKTHAGGLVYLISQEKTKKPVSVLIENVIEAPLYDINNKELKDNWHGRRKSPGLWADLVGRRIMLTVPSSSIQHLDDPEVLLNFWDEVVELHYGLCGILDEKLRLEWVVTDEHPRAGYMHAGYPVVTGLDVVSANKLSGILDVETLRKNGSWGMFHELGHNVQDGLWTFDGTSEVTCNIFTLHAMDVLCGQKPWIHNWLKKQMSHPRKYFQEGPVLRKWQSNAGLALFIYAQLARDFGWDAYNRVFLEYRNLKKSERPKGSSEKIQQWITRFSKTAGANLCPLFAFWGFPISEETKKELEALPGHLPKDEITEMAPDRMNDICVEYGIKDKELPA